jgi:hypothetical protein
MNGFIPPGQLRPLFGPAQSQSRLFRSVSNQSIPSTNMNPRPRPLLDRPFFGGTHLAFAVVVGTWLFAIGVSVAQVTTNQPPGSIGKGPIGWDSYRRLDLLWRLRSGTETRDFSSTDPAQENIDFDHPLRVTPDGQVIAEANGPGEIVSIWSTNDGPKGGGRCDF